ncbi:alpha-galactosidase [Paenalkalicoccus suaedae]|uniref:alpha-galactosidase n=1 Tax=Paenalkalicoccus suaedae TaxID=2592382 RepID=UPI00201BAF76|nr:alpha-galactosidase [Paenalkalicoccus suaedae]
MAHIHFDEKTKAFHLQTAKTSYIFQVIKENYLAHSYWGKRVEDYHLLAQPRYHDRGFSGNPNKEDRTFSLDTLLQEYPTYGHTDYRQPAIHVELENGSTVLDLRYDSHTITSGKKPLEGLPATYTESDAEAESLTVTLKDALTNLSVELTYSVFPTYDAITRSVRVVNNGEENVKLQQIASFNVDFEDADFDFITLAGAWARERDVERTPLRRGTQAIESRRGSSSHQQNPFFALARPHTTEDQGEAYGVSLVYSGSFEASIEVDQLKQARATMGIHSFDFCWLLEPSASFQAPETVLVYSANGLGDMSRTYHTFYRERLARGEHRDNIRPILINNWEATYFDFDEEKLVAIAEKAKQADMELFVLDDGWFGKREDDTTSLGDWFVNKEKLPNGLKGVADRVNDLGLQFGIWVEPEMVSEDSDLYLEHPDWCIHVPARRRSESRNQRVLDFSRQEVRDEIVKRISAVLESAPITYVKWDMNRNMTEIGSAGLPPERQRETAHRYMLGLYEVLETITTRYPHVLFESCSGGGGRVDPGMLYYMPQAWSSDNTDAVARQRIQYGSSFVYPTSSLGAHVSAVPNHQVNRITSLKARGDMAMGGVFGYELDATAFTDEELQLVKEQVNLYKEIRETVQFGDLYRLDSPFESGNYGTLYVNRNQTEAVLTYMNTLGEANAPFKRVKLAGLETSKQYTVSGLEGTFGGDELMNIGVPLPYFYGDFQTVLWVVRSVE